LQLSANIRPSTGHVGGVNKVFEDRPPEQTVRDDAVMLASLGILAYSASMLTHEAIGHGGFCIAVGGHNVMLTAWAERCAFPDGAPFGIEAAGPGVQFAAGLLSWLAMRHVSSHLKNLHAFLWLYMVFDLFIASGYVAFSGVTDFGDAAVVIAGLPLHALWRCALVALGAAAYYSSMRAATAELSRFIGGIAGRANRFVRIPYLTAGVLASCGAALNTTMPSTGITVGLAAVSSFGAGWGMLMLPRMMGAGQTGVPVPDTSLQRNIAWILAAGVVGVAFILVLGRGLE
jgi:hypothetical protein